MQQHGGVSVLWGRLIDSILHANVESEFLEYHGGFKNQVRKSLKIPQTKIKWHLNYPLFLERWMNIKIYNEKPFIVHSSHYRICKNRNAINITTVHDFTYERFSKGLQKKFHCWQKYKAIRNSDVIICISENTKRDLLFFLPDIDETKIKVVYNGVSDNYHQLSHKLEEYSDYILFVGGRHSYKNFNFAVEAVKKAGYKLLIVGNPLNNNEQLFLDKTLGIGNYKIIVHPDNEELNTIYNSVHCLLYPSSYEGFGIPVIEAQRAGCPVIALNASSIPEIIGNSDLLIDSLNTEEVTKKINLLKNKEIRKSEIDNGLTNSKRFSWDKMCKSYLSIYKNLLDKHD